MCLEPKKLAELWVWNFCGDFNARNDIKSINLNTLDNVSQAAFRLALVNRTF